MGLLDMLIKKGKKEVTRMAVNAIMDEVSKSAQEKFSSAQSTPVQNTPVQSTPTQLKQAAAPSIEDLFVDDKLRHVLTTEFSQYEIREQVSPLTLGGTGQFKPYDFGIYENGTPKLFIMVVYGNTCSQRKYRWSKEEAERAGVPMINFVAAFPNKLDYVVDRLHQYL